MRDQRPSSVYYPDKPKFVVLEHSMTSAGRDMFERREAHVIRMPDDKVKVLATISRSIDDDALLFKMVGFRGEKEEIRLQPQLRSRSQGEFLSEWDEYWVPSLPREDNMTPTMSLVAELEPVVGAGASGGTPGSRSSPTRSAEGGGARGRDEERGASLDAKSGDKPTTTGRAAGQKRSVKWADREEGASQGKTGGPTPASRPSRRRGTDLKGSRRASAPTEDKLGTHDIIEQEEEEEDDEDESSAGAGGTEEEEEEDSNSTTTSSSTDHHVVDIAGLRKVKGRGSTSSYSEKAYRVKVSREGEEEVEGEETDAEDFDYDSDDLKDPRRGGHGSAAAKSVGGTTGETKATTTAAATSLPMPKTRQFNVLLSESQRKVSEQIERQFSELRSTLRGEIKEGQRELATVLGSFIKESAEASNRRMDRMESTFKKQMREARPRAQNADDASKTSDQGKVPGERTATQDDWWKDLGSCQPGGGGSSFMRHRPLYYTRALRESRRRGTDELGLPGGSDSSTKPFTQERDEKSTNIDWLDEY